ncbi:MAG: nuclear transport factor 2 family protein [Bryobacterales bacterium]|nr:nuclear transport factor 2 family protein [Bryobacterales bacterium]
MESPEQAIRQVIENEGRAWDDGDVALLLSIFHPDAVWVWPQTKGSLDPLDWQMTVGRFHMDRWEQGWARIFSSEVLRNVREIRRIEISPEGDGAVAVVDVDTQWRGANGATVGWTGRAVKYYVKAFGAWKMIAHTGL